jgi:hypothetical protein
MLNPENPGQRRHHFCRFMAKKMFDQLRYTFGLLHTE